MSDANILSPKKQADNEKVKRDEASLSISPES